jgi:hypothetical protein
MKIDTIKISNECQYCRRKPEYIVKISGLFTHDLTLVCKDHIDTDYKNILLEAINSG